MESPSEAPDGLPILELQRVTKTYGDAVSAVRDVEVDVERGEFVTLLGPSGSGKSTLLKLIAGFLQPSAGDILLNGKSVVGVSPRARGIGMVLQNYGLFPHMCVGDNVGYGLRMRGWRRAQRASKVAAALELVGLSGMEHRLPAQLSGGEQQRVAFARALAFDPTLVLMDEPMGALDRELKVRMQNELRRIHNELGTTMIYVTHDRDEAVSMSDRVALIHDGIVDHLATPRELYELPRSMFAAQFFGSHNLLPGRALSDGQRVAHDSYEIEIVCEQQKLRVTSGVELHSGAEVVIAVPRESVSFRDPEGPVLAITGTVVQAVYLGPIQRVYLEVGKTTMIAEVGTDITDLEIGRDVRGYVPVSKLVACAAEFAASDVSIESPDVAGIV